MSAETIPAELRKLEWSDMPSYGYLSFDQLREAVSEANIGSRHHLGPFDPSYYAGHQQVGGCNYNSLNRIVTAFILADRSTRPAEPAPEVEVGPYPASNALEAEMREVEVGDGEVVAWAKPRGPWVMGEKFIWDEDRTEDWMMGIFTEPLVRLSTLEAERAKTAAATELVTSSEQERYRSCAALLLRAEAAEALLGKEAAERLAAEASLSRALQDRDEAVRVAAEAIGEADAEKAARSHDRDAESAMGTLHCGSENWEYREAHRIADLHRLAARCIRAIARLRADQPATGEQADG